MQAETTTATQRVELRAYYVQLEREGRLVRPRPGSDGPHNIPEALDTLREHHGITHAMVFNGSDGLPPEACRACIRVVAFKHDASRHGRDREGADGQGVLGCDIWAGVRALPPSYRDRVSLHFAESVTRYDPGAIPVALLSLLQDVDKDKRHQIEADAQGEPFACVDAQSGRLLVFVPGSHYSGGGSTLCQPTSFFTDLRLVVDARLQEELGGDRRERPPFDLAATYPPGSVLGYVRDAVLAATSDTPAFPPTPALLDSPTIWENTASYWSQLRDAMWSSKVDCSLALLKHMLEEGARPKLWCLDHQNHYGFRLRTRRHTWLVGEVFTWPDHAKAEKPQRIEVLSWSHNSIYGRRASVGGMVVQVDEEGR
jgi:hypothetical protein